MSCASFLIHRFKYIWRLLPITYFSKIMINTVSVKPATEMLYVLYNSRQIKSKEASSHNNILFLMIITSAIIKCEYRKVHFWTCLRKQAFRNRLNSQNITIFISLRSQSRHRVGKIFTQTGGKKVCSSARQHLEARTAVKPCPELLCHTNPMSSQSGYL